jgi:hypothetical protein
VARCESQPVWTWCQWLAGVRALRVLRSDRATPSL